MKTTNYIITEYIKQSYENITLLVKYTLNIETKLQIKVKKKKEKKIIFFSYENTNFRDRKKKKQTRI